MNEIIKKIKNFIKEKEGSTFTLVLMMGFVVILLTMAMMGYIFRDIGFTELDEDESRAFNFAEAGLSDMYLNIDKYYNEDIPLPSSPYTEEIDDGSEVQGSFIVDYEYHSDSGFSWYIITSKGIDKSGMERTVRAKVNVLQQGPILGIYDYVFTGQTATFSGNFKPLDGPFYTEGDLNLTAGSAILQEYGAGPIVVKGNLYMSGDTTNINPESLSVGGNVIMEGSAKIKGGQINIAGNLTISGGTYIDDDLVSPMIVMGDINMSGSARIGESGKDLILSCNGTINPWPSDPWAPIYATRDDSFTYTFDDPGYDVAALIDEYLSDVQSSALVISGNLTLDDRNVPYSYQDLNGNSLSFIKEGEKYVLEVHGNVIINGNLQIGVEEWWVPSSGGPSTNEIYYRGKGIIYTSGNINTLTKLIPLNIDDFSENALLVFVSNGEIESDIWRDYWVQPPSCSSPTMYMVALAKGNIKITKGVVRGTLIAGGVLDIDTSFSKVCYEENISENLPSDLPGNASSSGETIITKAEWQEVVNE